MLKLCHFNRYKLYFSNLQMMFKIEKDRKTSPPPSRGPSRKKSKMNSGDEHSDGHSTINSEEEDEHGSLFCTSRYFTFNSFYSTLFHYNDEHISNIGNLFVHTFCV